MTAVKRNFRVLVTPQDVELARRDTDNPNRTKSVCTVCVMARAIARHMKIQQDAVHVSNGDVKRDTNLWITRKNRSTKYYKLSRKGCHIVKNFDKGLPIEAGVYVNVKRVRCH